MTVERARAAIGEFLQRVNKPHGDLADDLSLYGGGLELDSLEAAELSAYLEDILGSDPFSDADELPDTIGEVLEFYRSAATA